MKILITGARGTVGSQLRQLLQHKGCKVESWDRSRVPIDDYKQMESYVKKVAPDVVYHLAIASVPTGRRNESWLVNYEWSSELAWICKVCDIKFIFTSTVLVFSNSARGPFTIYSQPDAAEGYGQEKRLAEERVFYQNPRASIARLGWQIGDAPGSNNMLDYFEKQMEAHGQINASTRWLPACSFLEDTAEALYMIAQLSPGIYMPDSNRGWNFFEIASALNNLYGEPWSIAAGSDFVYDQRMQDERIKLPSLAERLKDLAR